MLINRRTNGGDAKIILGQGHTELSHILPNLWWTRIWFSERFKKKASWLMDLFSCSMMHQEIMYMERKSIASSSGVCSFPRQTGKALQFVNMLTPFKAYSWWTLCLWIVKLRLSHKVHATLCFNDDLSGPMEFLYVGSSPKAFTKLTHAGHRQKAVEGAEVYMWLIYAGVLSSKVNQRWHRSTYLPSIDHIATVIMKIQNVDDGFRWSRTNTQLDGLRSSKNYPFTLEKTTKRTV